MIYPHDSRECYQPPAEQQNLVVPLSLFYHFLSMFDKDVDPEWKILTQLALSSGYTPDLSKVVTCNTVNLQSGANG